jgi:hypothetical protein
MSFKGLVFIAFASLILAIPAPASAMECCDGCQANACPMMIGHDGDQHAAAVLLPKIDAERPVRQTAVVWFTKPVLVGDRILLGKYIIEHDYDRQASGKPCTHIYAADDPRLPVVMFHCTHLERTAIEHGTVTVVSTGDPTGPKRLTAFQFAGEAAAHGVPPTR